jgi:hypothetical protein
MKSLWQFYEILRASINLGIDHPHSVNMIDRNYNRYHHIVQIDFNAMAQDQEGVIRFFN